MIEIGGGWAKPCHHLAQLKGCLVASVEISPLRAFCGVTALLRAYEAVKNDENCVLRKDFRFGYALADAIELPTFAGFSHVHLFDKAYVRLSRRKKQSL